MPITDDFNRANGDLGAGWELVAGSTELVIASNAVTANANFQDNIMRRTEDPFPDDQYSEAKISFTSGVSSAETWVGARVGATGDGYFARVDTVAVTLNKRVSGADSFVSDFSIALSPSTLYTVRIDCVGNTIRVFLEGIERINVIDASITDGKPGLRASGNEDRPTIDDFESTDFIAPPAEFGYELTSNRNGRILLSDRSGFVLMSGAESQPFPLGYVPPILKPTVRM
jgi:hypothetical protein